MSKTIKIVDAATEKHGNLMRRLGELCDADEVRYQDLRLCEHYYIVKRGRTFLLNIAGNRQDGGFLGGVDEV